MLTRSFWRFPTTALRRYVATLPRPTDTVAEELSDVSERRTPTEVIEIVRKARNESEIRRALGLDRTTAVKLFLENNRIQFNSVEDVLSRVQNSRKLKDLLSPALKTKKGSASVGQAYYWPPGVNVNSLMDVDRLLAYQLINSCGANPQIVWATGNVKTEQVTNWGFIDVPFDLSDNNNETPTDKREPNFNLPSISAAIAKAIDQLPQADLYLKRKSKVTAKKLKLDTSNAKRQLSNAMKDSVLFCAVNSRDSAAVVEVDTDVLVAKLESQGDGMKTIRAYVEEELGRNLENSVLQSSFVTLDSFDQFFIGTCCLMCLKFSQDLVSGQLNFGK